MTDNPSGLLRLSIAPDHAAFAGHFPGMPIVPGVVLLDEALHAVGNALRIDLSDCRIASAKFLSPVGPGALVEIRYGMSADGAIRVELASGERKVASASLRPAANRAGPESTQGTTPGRSHGYGA
jgi:3-hydroxyacyl-[acyl-carrier-protein] dehydratase